MKIEEIDWRPLDKTELRTFRYFRTMQQKGKEDQFTISIPYLARKMHGEFTKGTVALASTFILKLTNCGAMELLSTSKDGKTKVARTLCPVTDLKHLISDKREQKLAEI